MLKLFLLIFWITSKGLAAQKETFTFRIRSEVQTLDWNLAHTFVEADLMLNLMEGLVAFNERSELVGALALRWEVSSDRKKYTFFLKPGVTWSDGLPLKAQDFVYSWKRLLTQMTAAPYASLLFDLVGAEDYFRGTLTDFRRVGVQALDDRTLQVQLRAPIANWIQILSFWATFPMRQDILEKYENSRWQVPGRMVTLGPYMLESHDWNARIVLKANPRYHGTRGNVKQVVVHIIPEDSKALQLYEQGGLDCLSDWMASDLKTWMGRADFKKYPLWKIGFLGFSVKHYPVSNVYVRKAIAQALDRSKLAALLPSVQPAFSLIPSDWMDFKIGFRFDPLAARMDWKRSGVEGNTLKLHYLLPDWERSSTMAKWIQTELQKNLHLQVELHPLPHQTYRQHLTLESHDLWDFAWKADYLDPDTFLSLFLKNSGNNMTGWGRADYDRLVLQARVESSLVVQKKKYLEAQKILLEKEVVVIPIYYDSNLVLVKPRVQNLRFNGLGSFYLKDVSVSF
jgi:oligopeptide transport system substrate-binding protein